MYRFLLVLSIVVVASCAIAQVETESSLWEYGTLLYGDTLTWISSEGSLQEPSEGVFMRKLGDLLGRRKSGSGLVAVLNVAGVNGWELVDVDGNVFIFKRRVN